MDKPGIQDGPKMPDYQTVVWKLDKNICFVV